MNTKHLRVLLLGLLAFGLLPSCFIDLDNEICERGEGPTIVEEIFVPSFDGIDLQTDARVTIRRGESQSVEVRGQQNIIDLLDRDVSQGIWDIRMFECTRNADQLEISITVPEMIFVGLSGSGSIFSESVFEGSRTDIILSGSGRIDFATISNEIDVRVNGSGDLVLDIDGNTMNTDISGSGLVSVQGEVNEQELRISGSGDYRAFELLSRDGDIRIQGSGSARVSVSETLRANISGSGDIRYRGTPTLDVSVSGSGRIIDAN
ncbi:MAG: head GIN domain-containing protein [Bacteroidota bacterium]